MHPNPTKSVGFIVTTSMNRDGKVIVLPAGQTILISNLNY
jgi:hypothetical protein